MRFPGPSAKLKLNSLKSRPGAGGPAGVILGDNFAETSGYTVTADRVAVNKWTLAQAGTLTELHAWCRLNTVATPFKLCVYDDDGTAGDPGTRLLVTPELTMAAGSLEIVDIFASVNLALAAGDYWLGYIGGPTGNGGIARQTISGTYRFKDAVGQYATPPNPISGMTSAAITMSVWGVVT